MRVGRDVAGIEDLAARSISSLRKKLARRPS